MSRWYRAYTGTVTDDKLAEAALIAGCSRSVAIAGWHCLLESAANRNNCGSYDATARRVAAILCEPVPLIEALMAAFDELSLSEAGAICAWKKRQYQSDDSKDRVRLHRANKKGNANVTARNGDVTPPDTETDTELESSKEDLSSGDDRPLTEKEVLEAWRDRLVPLGFPSVKKVTPARKRQLKARLRDCSMDEWLAAFSALERSKFCQGHNDRDWWADLDFLLQPKSFTKLIEGAYDH